MRVIKSEQDLLRDFVTLLLISPDRLTDRGEMLYNTSR